MLETADMGAPTLMMPLLLYADVIDDVTDLVLMSECALGLRKQFNALTGFCEQHQLTVNLSKTKVVVFETRKSDLCDFVLSVAVADRVDSLQVFGGCHPCH